jgi:putative exporter of polyketide antibiotics
MKIAKPMLLVLTPVGVIGGVREAYRFGGGLVILMVALLTLISVAMISIVLTVRRERREEEARNKEQQ